MTKCCAWCTRGDERRADRGGRKAVAAGFQCPCTGCRPGRRNVRQHAENTARVLSAIDPTTYARGRCARREPAYDEVAERACTSPRRMTAAGAALMIGGLEVSSKVCFDHAMNAGDRRGGLLFRRITRAISSEESRALGRIREDCLSTNRSTSMRGLMRCTPSDRDREATRSTCTTGPRPTAEDLHHVEECGLPYTLKPVNIGRGSSSARSSSRCLMRRVSPGRMLLPVRVHASVMACLRGVEVVQTAGLVLLLVLTRRKRGNPCQDRPSRSDSRAPQLARRPTAGGARTQSRSGTTRPFPSIRCALRGQLQRR